jgi:hypothetical protein
VFFGNEKSPVEHSLTQYKILDCKAHTPEQKKGVRKVSARVQHLGDMIKLNQWKMERANGGNTREFVTGKKETHTNQHFPPSQSITLSHSVSTTEPTTITTRNIKIK